MPNLEDIVTALREDIAEITQLLVAQKPAALPFEKPAVETFGFVRPTARDITPWVDRRMVIPDVLEATVRALHGVSWAGTILSGERYEAAWREVEKLQKAGSFDPACGPYLGLQPEVVYFGLLTGAIALPDEVSFGHYDGARSPVAFRGIASIAEYLEGIPSLRGRTGGPRIGGE